jgi:hypothetical protein
MKALPVARSPMETSPRRAAVAPQAQVLQKAVAAVVVVVVVVVAVVVAGEAVAVAAALVRSLFPAITR